MRLIFYYEAKMIIEMREKLLTRAAVAFTFCATFKRAINRPKTDPRLFFSRIYRSMDKLLSYQEKKITYFFSNVQGSARKKT